MRIITVNAGIAGIIAGIIASLLAGSLSSAASAADDIATWRTGPGTIAAKAATAGDGIAAGARIVSGDHAIRVILAKAPASTLYLSPEGEMTIDEEPAAAGSSLVVHLTSGQLEADIADKAAYADVHVIGAAIDIRVTGTLFVVERVKKDTDYIALVHGRVMVNLRKDVAAALGASGAGVQLDSRQGLEGSTSGLGQVEALLGRPQIQTSSASERSSLQGQGGTPGTESSWDTSDAASSTEGGTEVGNGSTTTTDSGVNANTAGTSSVESGLTIGADTLIGQEVGQTLNEYLQHEITTQVVNQVLTGSSPLPPPPGHP